MVKTKRKFYYVVAEYIIMYAETIESIGEFSDQENIVKHYLKLDSNKPAFRCEVILLQ